MLLAGRVRGAGPDAAERGRAARRPARAAATSPTRCRTSSPAASSSASRSPARSSTTRPCCSPTSRPATSTPAPAPRCCGCCARGAEEGRAVVHRHPRGGRGRDRRPGPDAARREARRSDRAARSRACAPGRSRTLLAAPGCSRRRWWSGAADGRLRARHRLRPRRRAGRPARRDRALRRRARGDGRRARPRAAEPRGALLPLGASTDVPLARARPRHAPRRAAVVLGGRRGYAIVAGPRPRRPAAARSWSSAASRTRGTCAPATPCCASAAARRAWSGIALSPDNVAFPLAAAPRHVYALDDDRDFGRARQHRAAVAQRPVAGRRRRSTQARAVSFGLGRLAFVTREGVRVLLSQAAGIVIALLVAFSLVALVAAGTMLAAGARADVQRRLAAFGVQRALGLHAGRGSPRCTRSRRRSWRVPAGGARHRRRRARGRRPRGGAAGGAQRAAARAGRCRARCCWRSPRVVALVVGGGDVAGVARGTPPAGGDPARRRPAPTRRRGRARGGLAGLGARFATAARGRWVAAVVDDRRLRRRRAADARARLAARAAARRPGHGRQALPADRADRPGRRSVPCARSRASPPPRRATTSTPPTRSGSASRCG